MTHRNDRMVGCGDNTGCKNTMFSQETTKSFYWLPGSCGQVGGADSCKCEAGATADEVCEAKGASYNRYHGCICPSLTIGCGESRDGCIEGQFEDGKPAFYWLPDVCATCKCSGKTCDTNKEFTCGFENGDCIPKSYVCDGEDDCTDGKDEADCLTEADKLAECKAGQAAFSPQSDRSKDRCTCPSGSLGCGAGNACFRTVGVDGLQSYYWITGSCGTGGFGCECEIPADVTTPADQCRTDEAIIVVQALSAPISTAPATFGPQVWTPIRDMLVEIANPATGCTPLSNKLASEGGILLIERGGCNFAKKVYNGEQAGASAVVVYHNTATPSGVGAMSCDVNSDPQCRGGLGIPSVFIEAAQGHLR